MKFKNLLFLVLVISFISIQLFQPERNRNSLITAIDVSNIYAIPPTVSNILKNACYDCHSNNTIYPWYAYIQPLSWQIEKDIHEGKKMLNFSEFGQYTSRRRISKWVDAQKRIIDGTMPLQTYQWLHNNARLTQSDKQMIVDWIDKTILSTQKQY